MSGFFKQALLPVIIFSCAGITGCYAQAGDKGSAQEHLKQSTNVSEAGLRLVPLTISSGDSQHDFTVELAGTAEEQARGLMFRRELAPDKGMIFPFAQERMANFWMKNTPIPLDIIFIRADGTIESIAANTTPYSLDPVESGEPVVAVLELAGGRAAELSIAPGDIVKWQQ
ncbi:DUF192 domain-containing protein [Parasphingorhabdus sp. JC815]|uniref:DUF192 domain-containing protein n=1 Tax=Parasphingorhabdus sp. JC815 TaxID=3232140 RepID=UPI0034594C07